MDNFEKVVRIGQVPLYEYPRTMSVFCKIRFEDGRLSITGVMGPKSNGDCYGSCGQIDSTLRGIKPDDWRFADGWSYTTLMKFLELWGEWHLNDMRAGSPAQRAYLKAHPVVAVYPESHFDKACEALREAGLHPDQSYAHNHKAYMYGSAWLREDVPEDVLAWLKDLPNADMNPVWV